MADLIPPRCGHIHMDWQYADDGQCMCLDCHAVWYFDERAGGWRCIGVQREEWTA